MNDSGLTQRAAEEHIERSILLLRGQRVMLDRDLAALYGVETKNLNRAVQRNLARFPEDFMFQITLEEAQACAASRFQIGTLKRGLERKVAEHDTGIRTLFDAIRQLMAPPAQPRKPIGFRVKERRAAYRVK